MRQRFRLVTRSDFDGLVCAALLKEHNLLEDIVNLSRRAVLYPTGCPLMSFLMAPRTGLGRFRDFRISNYQLMMDLVDACTQLTIEEILELPDVKERVELYMDHADDAIDQI